MKETYFNKMLNKTINLETVKKNLEQTKNLGAPFTILFYLVLDPMVECINDLNGRLEKIEARVQ